MRKPGLAVLGVVIVLAGLLFTLQCVALVTGSTMSNTTSWSVVGPVIILFGLGVAVLGARGRRR